MHTLCSTFDAAQSDALDDLSRGNEVDDCDGCNGDHGSRHLQIEIRRAVTAHESVECQLYGPVVWILEVDERPEKVVPLSDEGQDHHGRERGPDLRQDDLP